MSTLRAVVFTRPYPIGLGDYTFFVRPVEFVKDRHYFDAHIRNVLHEDDSRAIGSIKERRWHVLRRGDLVIVGMATNEFGRRDESGRAIRGYYGFAMPADNVKLPSIALFKELDKVCVEPAFMQAPVRTKDSDCLSGELFDDPAQYKIASDSHKWSFNTNPKKMCFHCCDEVRSILSAALVAASQNDEFELVVGLNTIEHAKKLPILNCVCHAVSATKEILLPEYSAITDSTSTQKSDSVEESPSSRQMGKGPSDQGEPPLLRKASSFVVQKASFVVQKILGRRREPHKGPAPLEGAIHTKNVEAEHRGNVQRLWEEGFEREENRGTSGDQWRACDDQDEKITKPTGDAVQDNEPHSTSLQAMKTHEASKSADPLIKIVQALVRLQDEIDGMRKCANESVSLKLEHIADSLREVMIYCGATPIDGDALFDARLHCVESLDAVKDGTLIAKTKRPGWRIGDQVLRRALVTVYSF